MILPHAPSRFRIVRTVTLAVSEAEREAPGAPHNRAPAQPGETRPFLVFTLHGHPACLGTVPGLARPGAVFKRRGSQER